MQEEQHRTERQSQQTSINQEVVFFSEDQISENLGADEWVMPCGHDCCQCDRECK